MDRRPALAAAVAALLVLVAVWQAVQAPEDAPALAMLRPAPEPAAEDATPTRDEATGPAPGAEDGDADDGTGRPPRPQPDPENRIDAEPAAPQDHEATCSFQHRGARSPEQNVGVANSGTRCQFRIDPLAWTAVRVTVRVDGVQAQQELSATLYAHRTGGREALGSTSGGVVVGGTTTLQVTADPAALDSYRVFELELDGVGASVVDVRVDAVLTA